MQTLIKRSLYYQKTLELFLSQNVVKFFPTRLLNFVFPCAFLGQGCSYQPCYLNDDSGKTCFITKCHMI